MEAKDNDINNVVSHPRIAPLGGNKTLVEAIAETELLAIKKTGRRAIPAGPGGISSVNVIFCLNGDLTVSDQCRVTTDPRRASYGLNIGEFQ